MASEQPLADPAPDLSFVTTEQLIVELFARHRAVLIVREFETRGKQNHTDTIFDYNGGLNAALGLAHRAIYSLQEDAKLGRLKPPEDAG